MCRHTHTVYVMGQYDVQYVCQQLSTFSSSKVSIQMILARYFRDLPSPWFRQAWRKHVRADTASVRFLEEFQVVAVHSD